MPAFPEKSSSSRQAEISFPLYRSPRGWNSQRAIVSRRRISLRRSSNQIFNPRSGIMRSSQPKRLAYSRCRFIYFNLLWGEFVPKGLVLRANLKRSIF